MTPTAIEIGGLALIFTIFGLAQRLSGWENRPLASCLGIAAIGLFLAWCFLFFPAPVAWGVAAVVWSTGLWFVFPLVRKSVDDKRGPTAVTSLPLIDTGPDPAVALNVVGKQLERAGPDTKWVFKSKLRIMLTSEIGDGIDILAPEWIANKGDVPAQLLQGFCSLQVEGSHGWKADDWRHEVGRLHVQHGETFRLWIGLDQSVSDSDLRRRSDQQRLGTLILPVKMGGKYFEFKKRF